MQSNNLSITRERPSLSMTHSVLRNTYLLLSLTLIFSSLLAMYAVKTNATATFIPFILGLVSLFAVYALRNSALGIVAVFAFTGCMGYSMGPLLNHFIKGYSNGGQLIATAFAGTGLTFFLSSAYILVTKKDMSAWGKFLMIGMVVCIIGGLANFFLHMPAMQLAISTAMVFISTMLMMYDTSRIVNSGETNYLLATVTLFLDIVMLFQNLLILLGALNGRD